MLKELAHKPALSLVARGRVFGHIARSGNLNRFAFCGGVLAGGIDSFFVFSGTKSSHGIEMLQAKAEWIDDGMTSLAGCGTSQFGDFLPHGEARIETAV